MGSISDSGVIVLCIVGAGAVLLIGWAVGHRVWQNREDEGGERRAEASDTGFSQFAYMRELRERYKEGVAANVGHYIGRSERKEPLTRVHSTHIEPTSAGPGSNYGQYYGEQSTRPSTYYIE